MASGGGKSQQRVLASRVGHDVEWLVEILKFLE
jgi:hypothetical protein